MPFRPILLLVGAALLGACASMSNTLAQDLAEERWRKCRGIPGVELRNIQADGQIWVVYTSGTALKDWQECDSRAAAEQGRQRVAVGGAAPVAIAAQSPTPAQGGTLPIPTWKRGDEWAYRWESSQGAGTFVWMVDREEAVDGATYYVIKSGTREIYFRKNDFAYHMDKVSGQVETRHSPPTINVPWPLAPGLTWEQRYTRERPVERQTEDLVLTCQSGPTETLTVPAGTFETVKIACSNARTRVLSHEVWFSPVVKQMVRERTYFPYGRRERELIGFKLR